MKEERLRAEQSIPNEVIEAYRDQGIIEHCSEEMRYQLGRNLADKISDGNSYVVTMGEERLIPDYPENVTRLCRTIHVQRLIRCINCKYTPQIAEECLPFVERLICHRSGETVHPQGFCAWGAERSDKIDFVDCSWR